MITICIILALFLVSCEKQNQQPPGSVNYCIECRDKSNQVYNTCATLDTLNAWQKKNGLHFQKKLTCLK